MVELRNFSRKRIRLVAYAVILAAFSLLLLTARPSRTAAVRSGADETLSLALEGHSSPAKLPAQIEETQSDTLVVFAYHECGPVCVRDLEYFLNVAVWKDSGADYFIVSNGACSICKRYSNLTSYGNVRFIRRENEGFDFGAYVAALETVDIQSYQYFIFMNAGVRGPLLPRYALQNIKHWHKRFTDLLVDDVKLVGPTISCELQIHVQSYCFALERQGLELAMEKGAFPRDASSIGNLIIDSELGMTKIMRENGYTFASFMVEYANYDWNKKWNEEGIDEWCNNRTNPTIANNYHKQDIDLYEVMFHKIGGSMRRFCPDGKCSYDEPVERASRSIEEYVRRIRPSLPIQDELDGN